jgi:hypothetical protein
MWVAVGDSNSLGDSNILYSYDAYNWQTVNFINQNTTRFPEFYSSLCWDGYKWIALGSLTTNTTITKKNIFSNYYI